MVFRSVKKVGHGVALSALWTRPLSSWECAQGTMPKLQKRCSAVDLKLAWAPGRVLSSIRSSGLAVICGDHPARRCCSAVRGRSQMFLLKSLDDSARPDRDALLFDSQAKSRRCPTSLWAGNRTWGKDGLGARAPGGVGSPNPWPLHWIAHGWACTLLSSPMAVMRFLCLQCRRLIG